MCWTGCKLSQGKFIVKSVFYTIILFTIYSQVYSILYNTSLDSGFSKNEMKVDQSILWFTRGFTVQLKTIWTQGKGL